MANAWQVARHAAQDARFAFRTMFQNRAFTAVALATLALGIGANTAIFTVVNAVLLDPLPYPDSNRIVNIARRGGGANSVPMFTYWNQNSSGLENLTAYQNPLSINMAGGSEPELVDAMQVSRDYFRLFGANPILGRTFTDAEDQPGGAGVLLMSYGLWQRRFAGDPSVLGRGITLGGESYEVAGVLSPSFQPYPATDVWIPLRADPNSTNQAHTLNVAGRLADGTTLAQANARMAVLGRQYVEEHPEQLGNDDDLEVTTLRQRMTGNVQPALLMLLGAVGLVLLIACANVANLLLARATAREREIAVRAAIGAGRGRIVRQLLTESLLLAVAGGALGLLLGAWGMEALLAMTPGDLPRAQELASSGVLDPLVAGFALLLTVVTGILFGLAPALRLSRTDLVSPLKEGSGRTGSGLKHGRTRSFLVAGQVAIAVVLLCGAGLLIRSFAAMRSVSLGFDPRNLLTMEISLSGADYATTTSVDRLAREFVEHAERLPGVESAAFANSLPLKFGLDMIFDIPGRPPLEGYKFTGNVQWRFVSTHYFDVLRIPLLSGRLFQEQESGRTVIINQAMAERFWPDEDPIGQTMIVGHGLGPFEQGVTEVIGVVGNVRARLDAGPAPTMYQLPSEATDAATAFINGLQRSATLVRTRPGVTPMSVSQRVQEVLLETKNLPAAKMRTMEQLAADSVARQNFNLFLLGLFAAIALLLASVGIYGVMSYSVDQRAHEIGIRTALGASPRDTLKLVLSQALRMTLAGIAVGVAAAFGLTRLISAQLFGVEPTDPVTFAAVALVLFAVAFAAACVPAVRATQVDPIAALRRE